ncbi:hypothetical protein [Chitinophaga sp. OAE865]|uniref:hypothetical protein n=1 Tax=Chitinophaga sp. OAE865 TaxID=2817898 RepID=UPI001AE8D0BE
MSIIRNQTIENLPLSINGLEDYYQDIRALFNFIEIRFRVKEYGVNLESVSKNTFFSNDSGYKLSDDSDYPFYLWTPSWLGRFYADFSSVKDRTDLVNTSIKQIPIISFIWIWHGSGDAYVKDTNSPECWVGVADPILGDSDKSIYEIADMIFKHFRFETTKISQFEDWFDGKFHPNTIGNEMNGTWQMKRIPLKELNTFFEVERMIIKPLSQKYLELCLKNQPHKFTANI